MTIPSAPFEAAELAAGDRFRVEAEAKGRVVITRIEEYMERYAGQLEFERESDASESGSRVKPEVG